MNALTQLTDAINTAWKSSYPGCPDTSSIMELVNRVKTLESDRRCWVDNCRFIRTDVLTRVKSNLTGYRLTDSQMIDRMIDEKRTK